MIQRRISLPKVSIIIPVYNGELFIGKCIERLLAQDYPRNKMEIIVCDDGSNDSTRDIVKSYDVTCISSTNKGPSHARNLGVKQASGQILVFMDADCLAHKKMIMRHVMAHMYYRVVDPKVMIIGGGIGGYNKNFWAACDGFSSWYNYHPRLPKRQVNHQPTANMSVWHELMDRVRFDEELRFGEDYAFCVTADRKGYKIIFEPQAKVLHINRTTLKSYMDHAKQWGSYQYQLREKGFAKPICSRGFLWLLRALIYECVYKVAEIIYYSFWSKSFGILVAFPFVFCNKLYLFHSMLKGDWAFYKDHELTRRQEKAEM